MFQSTDETAGFGFGVVLLYSKPLVKYRVVKCGDVHGLAVPGGQDWAEERNQEHGRQHGELRGVGQGDDPDRPKLISSDNNLNEFDGAKPVGSTSGSVRKVNSKSIAEAGGEREDESQALRPRGEQRWPHGLHQQQRQEG